LISIKPSRSELVLMTTVALNVERRRALVEHERLRLHAELIARSVDVRLSLVK
jgi:hypothetical protein